MGILHGSAYAGLRVLCWKSGGLPKRDSPLAGMAHISVGWMPGRTCALEISRRTFKYTSHWSGLGALL